MNQVLSTLRRAVATVTPLGWTVAALGVLAWLAGAVFGWQELMIVAATCLVLFVVAALFTFGKVDLSSSLHVEPARVVVGERAAGSLTMRNESKRHSRGVRVELPVGAASAVFQVPRLASGAEHEELFVVPTARRAVIPVGPITTVQGDPLGLFRRTRVWSETYEIFVHPATVALDTIAAGLVRDLEGQTTNHLSNSDIAFHTLRDYVPGDDRRHVHWKTSAKLDKLMVRQYVDTRRSHIAVMLSTDPADYVDDDEFELAVSCAASIAQQTLRDGQTLSVFAGTTELPATNPRHLFDHFSRVEETPDHGGADECFATARRLAPDASVGALAVGSTRDIGDLHRASTRASLDTSVVVLHCKSGSVSNYRLIGTSRFVVVPELPALRRGLLAVLG